MSRTTIATLRVLVKTLNETCGLPTSPYVRGDDGNLRSIPGCYVLDCAYGGYRLAQIANEQGAESNITPRYPAGPTADLIRAYMDGIREGSRK